MDAELPEEEKVPSEKDIVGGYTGDLYVFDGEDIGFDEAYDEDNAEVVLAAVLGRLSDADPQQKGIYLDGFSKYATRNLEDFDGTNREAIQDFRGNEGPFIREALEDREDDSASLETRDEESPSILENLPDQLDDLDYIDDLGENDLSESDIEEAAEIGQEINDALG